MRTPSRLLSFVLSRLKSHARARVSQLEDLSTRTQVQLTELLEALTTTRLDAEHRYNHLLAHMSLREGELNHRLIQQRELIERLDADLRRLSHTSQDQTRRLDQMNAALGESRARTARLTRHLQVYASTRWFESLPVEGAKVSVVMPTRHRPRYLERAVSSVLAQRYENFELLIVDDGDDSSERVANVWNDPRVRVLRNSTRGHAAARNFALQHATGSLIAYLDDDNLMLPCWLAGVAWAFAQAEGRVVLYGARLLETRNPVGDVQEAEISFDPYDRRRLLRTNYIDLNTIAHRANLAEARFDESLDACVDWDLFLRLTATSKPFELPVLACTYTQDAPGRLSDRVQPELAVQEVKQRHPTLRVLGYNAMYPLLSESYIGAEMEALVEQGVELAFCRRDVAACDMPVEHPVYTDIDLAVREFRPDCIVVYWATFADAEFDNLLRLQVPFALRVHSFDFECGLLRKIQGHPLCIGVWVYPELQELLPGSLALPTLMTGWPERLPPLPYGESRNIVLACGAGLPKRDWDFVIDVMSRLPELDNRIVMSQTNHYEYLPLALAQKCLDESVPARVQINVSPAEVQQILRRTSVLIYALREGAQPYIGNPRTVIEAAAAGALVLMPDRPGMRRFAGPIFEAHTDAAGTADRIRQITNGSAAIEAVRARNQSWASERFFSPALGRRFFTELVEALGAFSHKKHLGRAA